VEIIFGILAITKNLIKNFQRGRLSIAMKISLSRLSKKTKATEV
jgi:hypothetical protein